MASTSIGTVFLYEARDDDIRDYSKLQDAPAPARIRWLLERIASRSSSDPGGSRTALTRAEVASLAPAEIESLFEIYLGSPKNQWYQMKSLEANNPIVRGGGEAASDFFDRLVGWYAGYRNDSFVAPPPAEPLAGLLAGIQASQQSIETSLRWAAGVVILAVAVMSAGASWLAYESHVRGAENDRKAEAWQREMKMIAENNSAMERGFAELAAENARLQARLAALERRPGPAPRAGLPPRKAPAKTPAKTANPAPRK